MNSNLFSLYSFSILYFSIRETTGEHVLPVFQGLWYNKANCLGADACLQAYYNYSDFLPTPEDVLKNSALPYYSDCTWTYDEATYSSDSVMPVGFVGTPDDWQQIILDPNAALEGYYFVECDDVNGMYKHYSFVDFYPLYLCPPSSRLTLYDNITLEEGCSTTPMPCVADVVGRSFNYTGLGLLGHLGLVTSIDQNPDIIEVLNGTKTGIFLTPLYGENSFATKTKYWGERYGVLDGLNGNYTLNLDLLIAGDIIDLALAQSNYLFKYTKGWSYYPGGTQDDPDYCKFRCDSFVYYLYKISSLIIQPTFSFPTGPLMIFDDFLCSADPISSCPYFPITKKVGFNQSKNIEALIPQEFLDIQDTIQTNITLKLEIFNMLRPVLFSKVRQKYELLAIVDKYQKTKHSEELLVRCICFELGKMQPEHIDDSVRPLLLKLLLMYKNSVSDNFLLAVITNRVGFFIDNPLCRWPNAYFTVDSENLQEKESKIINYIDGYQTAVEQANLVSSSRLSLFKTLSIKKKCEYGSFFYNAYHQESQVSNKEKNILILGLVEMKYPRKKTDIQYSYCNNV